MNLTGVQLFPPFDAQPAFDFDLTGLAARLYLRPNWAGHGKVLRDDFDPTRLEEAAERHNQACEDCKYRTD